MLGAVKDQVVTCSDLPRLYTALSKTGKLSKTYTSKIKASNRGLL
jgi:hypothetical protein